MEARLWSVRARRKAAADAFVSPLPERPVGSVDRLIRRQVGARLFRADRAYRVAQQNVQRLQDRHGSAGFPAATKNSRRHADAFLAAFGKPSKPSWAKLCAANSMSKRKIEGCNRPGSKPDTRREKGARGRGGKALERATHLLAAAQGRLNGNPVARERARIDHRIETERDNRSGIAAELLGALQGVRNVPEVSWLPWPPGQPGESAYKAAVDRLVLDLAGSTSQCSGSSQTTGDAACLRGSRAAFCRGIGSPIWMPSGAVDGAVPGPDGLTHR